MSIEVEIKVKIQNREDVLEAVGYSMKDTTRTSYLSMLMKKDKDGRIFRTRQHLFPSGCPLP